MGKKKIISKQEKPAKVQKQQKVVQKVQKKPKKAAKQQGNFEIITPELHSRFSTFQAFYRQVLELKSKTNQTNLNDQIATVNNKVRDQLETTSSKILRNELIDLQKWIEGEQTRLQNQIDTVRSCYQQNQKSLQSTKVFTVDEIAFQLKAIQLKIDQKQNVYDEYGVYLTRSRKIYSEGQQNDANDNQNEVDMNLE